MGRTPSQPLLRQAQDTAPCRGRSRSPVDFPVVQPSPSALPAVPPPFWGRDCWGYNAGGRCPPDPPVWLPLCGQPHQRDQSAEIRGSEARGGRDRRRPDHPKTADVEPIERGVPAAAHGGGIEVGAAPRTAPQDAAFTSNFLNIAWNFIFVETPLPALANDWKTPNWMRTDDASGHLYQFEDEGANYLGLNKSEAKNLFFGDDNSIWKWLMHHESERYPNLELEDYQTMQDANDCDIEWDDRNLYINFHTIDYLTAVDVLTRIVNEEIGLSCDEMQQPYYIKKEAVVS